MNAVVSMPVSNQYGEFHLREVHISYNKYGVHYAWQNENGFWVFQDEMPTSYKFGSFDGFKESSDQIFDAEFDYEFNKIIGPPIIYLDDTYDDEFDELMFQIEMFRLPFFK